MLIYQPPVLLSTQRFPLLSSRLILPTFISLLSICSTSSFPLYRITFHPLSPVLVFFLSLFTNQPVFNFSSSPSLVFSRINFTCCLYHQLKFKWTIPQHWLLWFFSVYSTHSSPPYLFLTFSFFLSSLSICSCSLIISDTLWVEAKRSSVSSLQASVCSHFLHPCLLPLLFTSSSSFFFSF